MRDLSKPSCGPDELVMITIDSSVEIQVWWLLQSWTHALGFNSRFGLPHLLSSLTSTLGPSLGFNSSLGAVLGFWLQRVSSFHACFGLQHTFSGLPYTGALHPSASAISIGWFWQRQQRRLAQLGQEPEPGSDWQPPKAALPWQLCCQ